MNEKEILTKAVDTWGVTAQITMVYEEMAELQKELCKNFRGKENVDEIAEEVADVEIMLEQLKIIFNIDDLVEEERKRKLERLEQRLVKYS